MSSQLVEQACLSFPNVLIVDPEPGVQPVIECQQDSFGSAPGDQYYMRKVVGSGASGTAVIGRRKRDNLGVIAKVIDISEMNQRQLDRTRSEVECLSSCRHSAIIQYLMHEENGNGKLLVVMELADAGDLGFQIKHRRDTGAKFLEHEVTLMFVQVVMALDYIHSQGILHRDLKPANIFVKANGLVKVGDFGLSKMYDENVSLEVASSLVGTPYYLAPEVWKREMYNKKADMFSLGVLLHELLTLERPFKGPNVVAVMTAITTQQRGALPEHITSDTVAIVDSLLQFEPSKRPNTLDLLETPLMDHALRVFRGIVNGLPASDSSKAFIQRDIKHVRDRLKKRFEEKHPRRIVSESEIDSMGKTGPLVFLEDGKKWKQRYLKLSSLGIAISKQPDGFDNPLKLVAISDIFNVIDVPKCFADNRANAFAVILQNDDALWFYAQTDDGVAGWISSLRMAIGL